MGKVRQLQVTFDLAPREVEAVAAEMMGHTDMAVWARGVLREAVHDLVLEHCPARGAYPRMKTKTLSEGICERWSYRDDGPLYYIKVTTVDEKGDTQPYFLTGLPSSKLLPVDGTMLDWTIEVDLNLSEDPRDGVLTEDDAHTMLEHVRRVTEPPPGDPLNVVAVNIRALLLGPTKTGRVGMRMRSVEVVTATREVVWEEKPMTQDPEHVHHIRGPVRGEAE